MVNDESKDIDWVHGRVTSPLYARYRIITLEWIIDRINWDDALKVKHLEDLFSLQSNLWSLDEKELYIKDSYLQEWKLNVKIKEPLEVIEWDEEFYWSYYKWRIVLESTSSPIYKSYEELIVNWNEWNIWGFTMWFELWIAFDLLDEIIEVNTLKTETPTKFEITAIRDLNSPLTIKNITNNTFFALDITGVSWDIIVIDSNNFTATKNGISVIANRISWSIWQKISWDNQFVITDKDWNIFNKDFTVKVYYRNALL